MANDDKPDRGRATNAVAGRGFELSRRVVAPEGRGEPRGSVGPARVYLNGRALEAEELEALGCSIPAGHYWWDLEPER